MLAMNELQFSSSLMVSSSIQEHLEISRLVAAAVVNPTFCNQLLVDPNQAIEDGYYGETFSLTDTERYLLLSIHADSLAELTEQITQAFGWNQQVQLPSITQAPVFIGT